MIENRGKAPIQLQVITPTKKILECETQDVYFPGIDGRLGILQNHVNLICQIGCGVVFFNFENQTQYLSVSGGVAQVKDNQVVLLVDVAEEGANLDIGRAQESLSRSQSRLAGKLEADKADFDRAREAEKRALARLEAAKLSERAVSAQK